MMRLPIALCLCAAMAASAAQSGIQTERPPHVSPPAIAFRVDDEHVLATVRPLLDDSIPQFKRGQATEAVAKFGYSFIDLPEKFQPTWPSNVRAGDRWTLHTAPGQVFHATAERFVLGQGGCENFFALLMKIDGDEASAFREVRTKYYVADLRDATSAPSSLGPLPASAMSPKFRARLEGSLAEAFALEFPRVRAEAAKGIAQMAASDVGYHRSWARERQEVEAGLARGAGVLTYDTQPFRLTPDGMPLVFVRAKWHVGSRLGFAAAFWVSADTGAIVWRNLRPASWLRMFMFQSTISTAQLGLVLNVVDHDRDGWAEVIFLQAGYEGIGIELFDVSANDVRPSGIRYEYGC